MQINKKLNFVVPVEITDGKTLYVHSTPLSASSFDLHYMVLAQTHTKIFGSGLGALAGPRVAAKLLRDIAKKSDVWDGPEGVEFGVFAEMRRLTNVIVQSETGWSPISFQEAIARKMIDEEDQDTLENALIFFIVISAILKREESKAVLEVAGNIWSAQTTLLNSTAYAASLPTLTATDSSGENKTLNPSSVPH